MKFDHIHSLQLNDINNKQAKELINLDKDKHNELNNNGFNLVHKSVHTVDTDDSEAPKKGLNLRPLWRTVQRKALLIAAITATTTIASLYLLPKSSRIYEGNFRLLVEPITSDAKLTDPSVLSRSENSVPPINIDYPTLLQVLQSPTLLSKISKRIRSQYPDFRDDTLSQNLVTHDLVIRRVGTNLSDFTKLIEVDYRAQDPDEIQIVLKEILNEYL